MQRVSKPSDRKELNIIDFGWRLLFQWKWMVPIIIIVTIIVAGLLFSHDLKTADIVSRQQQLTEKDLVAPLNEEEQETVYFLAKLKKDAEGDALYEQTSALKQIDPYNAHELSFYYVIRTYNEMDLATVKQLYYAFLKSRYMTNALSDAFGQSLEDKELEELIRPDRSIEDETQDLSNGVLAFKILLPEGADTTNIQKIVESEIATKHQEWQTGMAAHTMTQFAVEETVGVDEELIALRRDRNATIANSNAYLNSRLKSLSEDQKTLYTYLVSDQLPLSDEEVVSDGQTSASLSIKGILLGLILGIILVVMIELFRELLMPVVFKESELLETESVHNFGGLYAFEKQTGRGQLMQSKTWFDLRYKKKPDIKTQQASVHENMTRFLKAKQYQNVLPVTLDVLSEAQEALVRPVLEAGEKDGVLQGVSYPLSPGLTEGTKQILLVMSANKTSYKKIDELMQACADYEVELVGTILLCG